MRASDYESIIRAYFAACTAGDAEAISAFFTPDAVHYFPDGDTFPDGTPQEPFRGAEAIGHGFGTRFGGEFHTRWTVDHVLADPDRHEAVIEWSNFKPNIGGEHATPGHGVVPLRRSGADPGGPGLLRVSARRSSVHV